MKVWVIFWMEKYLGISLFLPLLFFRFYLTMIWWSDKCVFIFSSKIEMERSSFFLFEWLCRYITHSYNFPAGLCSAIENVTVLCHDCHFFWLIILLYLVWMKLTTINAPCFLTFQLDWAAFAIMTMPSIIIPFILFWSSKTKYETIAKQKKEKSLKDWTI